MKIPDPRILTAHRESHQSSSLQWQHYLSFIPGYTNVRMQVCTHGNTAPPLFFLLPPAQNCVLPLGPNVLCFYMNWYQYRTKVNISGDPPCIRFKETYNSKPARQENIPLTSTINLICGSFKMDLGRQDPQSSDLHSFGRTGKDINHPPTNWWHKCLLHRDNGRKGYLHMDDGTGQSPNFDIIIEISFLFCIRCCSVWKQNHVSIRQEPKMEQQHWNHDLLLQSPCYNSLESP